MPDGPVRRPHLGGDHARQSVAAVVRLVCLRAALCAAPHRSGRAPSSPQATCGTHPAEAAEDRRAGHGQRAPRQYRHRLGLSAISTSLPSRMPCCAAPAPEPHEPDTARPHIPPTTLPTGGAGKALAGVCPMTAGADRFNRSGRRRNEIGRSVLSADATVRNAGQQNSVSHCSSLLHGFAAAPGFGRSAPGVRTASSCPWPPWPR